MYTPEFLVGYVQAKVGQLRTITHRLGTRHDFTTRELGYIQQEIMDIDVEVHVQAKMINDDAIRPKMLEYSKIYVIAEELFTRREKEAKAAEAMAAPPPAESPPIQFGEVNMAMYEDKKEEVPVAKPPSIDDNAGAALEIGSELEIYASDNEEPMPLECLSTITVTRGYQPVQFPRPKKEENEPVASTSKESVPGKEGLREVARAELNRRRANEPSSSQSVQSHRSHASYVSSKQETFTRPVTGRAYPPIQRTMPTTISRKDPNIIGMSEIFVHPPQNAHICPICVGKHKMYRCTTMLRAGLQERWFRALRAGVCLNCLIRGHSSFTCISVGACRKCTCRHNSILCPKNPKNE